LNNGRGLSLQTRTGSGLQLILSGRKKSAKLHKMIQKLDKKFILKSELTPKGDQPQAIEKLIKNLKAGNKNQILYGVTGSGKTYVMAKIIEALQKPALVLSHNKTLAAQVCMEFQDFFPENAVSYFVSYYDYYQPEAYLPATDTFIEKDAAINEEIEKFRHKATTNLLTRNDTLVVATVSCIYGMGDVEDYMQLAQTVKVGDVIQRDIFLRHLADMQYMRSGMDFKQGMFHVLGDTVEVFPPDRDTVFRFDFFGDDIEKIEEADSFTGEVIKAMDSVTIFPAKHDIATETKIKNATKWIEKDLKERYDQLRKIGKNIEAERVKTRTEYDIEMMLETGYCSGIENYARYLHGDGNHPAEPNAQPTTLMDYFPDDYILFIDESHITVPQIGAMHGGNYSRKLNLVEHGYSSNMYSGKLN